MIEPWYTRWSKWVYTRLHSEPFVTESDWKIPSTGPLSGANGALPWIVFERDKALFETLFPQWQIRRIELMMPASYVLSGGVSMRSLMPGWMYRPVRAVEQLLNQKRWAMFALIDRINVCEIEPVGDWYYNLNTQEDVKVYRKKK